MHKLKYILILLIFSIFIPSAEALDIQYGALKGYTSSQVLIEYYSIGKKNSYLCDISNLKCSITKKTTIGKSVTPIIKKSLKTEIANVDGNHSVLSASGKWLAYFIPGHEPERTRTYVIKNIKENKNYTLTESLPYWDLVNDQKKIFEFSPDEKTLLYVDDKNNDLSLYKVNLTTLKETSFESVKIETFAWTIGTFLYFDSNNVYYVGNTKVNPYKWSMYSINLKTGANKLAVSDVSYLDKITKIGTSLVFIRMQEKGYGPEIYNTKTKKVGYFRVPNIKTTKSIVHEEYVKVGNQSAVVMTPLSYDSKKTYPVLIWLHGGPLRQTSLGYHPYHSYGLYDGMLKLLQKNNVIILKLDYRGSLGFGSDYSEKIKGTVGKGDIDDVMEAVAYTKNQYNVSDVYLAGNSYGGYMSLKSVVEHPGVFKGVFSINGVTDWESLLVKMKNSIFNTYFNGLPNSENRNLYDQASIINKISNLGNERIEIIQGEADGTIPLWQANLLYGKLKDANKNVNLTTYKDEDHVFKIKKNIGDVCVRLFGLIGISNSSECTK